MRSPLDRLDEGLYALAGRTLRPWQRRALLGVVTAALFAFLLTRSFPQLEPGMGPLALTAALFALTGLLFMLPAFGRIAREEGDLGVYLLCAAACGALLLARLAMLEKETGDYTVFLLPWYQQMQPLAFAQAMREEIGNYTMPYRYFIWLMTRVPLPPMYLFKLTTLLFEPLLAYAVMRLFELRAEKRSLGGALCAYLLTLALPTVVFNGAYWGQCDAIYTAFLLFGLCEALEERPYRAMAGFGLALAFKLQAVFLFPLLPVLWAVRRVRIKHLLALPGAWLAAQLPALLGGCAPVHVLSPYFAQMGDSMELAINAPSLFQLFNAEEMNPWMFRNYGIAMALFAALGLCALLWRCRARLTPALLTDAAFLLVLAVPYLLPHMHERYFFAADVLSVAYWAGKRERFWASLLTVLASFNCYLRYMQYHFSFVSMPAASLMMLAVLALAGAGLAHDLQRPRAE